MAVDFIQDRDVLATIPKAADVDVRVSVVRVGNSRVLEIQDVTRSTGHVSRGWYCTSTPAGRACMREIAAVLAAFVMEEEV